MNKRIKSITLREYRFLFGKEPPRQDSKRVDGTFFRQMVDLWIFLNGNTTKADLYREFFGGSRNSKTDYRLFNGHILTVDVRLEKMMAEKFLANGLDEASLKLWIHELKSQGEEQKIPYENIRPILFFISDTVGIHPSALLDQLFNRYETGELKTVHRKIYDRAVSLKQAAKRAHSAGTSETEKLKECFYGKKEGYTLFSEIEEELDFLKKYAWKSFRGYLGRSIGTYRRGKLKRIADWRARNIRSDCEDIVSQWLDLPINFLPERFRKKALGMFLKVLSDHITAWLFKRDGLVFEKTILTPSYYRDEYVKQQYGFTRFDSASNMLGMKKKAFDLMVAKNCNVFREVGIYTERWYLSNLYLKELAQKQYFDLISTKYELMARDLSRSERSTACMK